MACCWPAFCSIACTCCAATCWSSSPPINSRSLPSLAESPVSPSPSEITSSVASGAASCNNLGDAGGETSPIDTCECVRDTGGVAGSINTLDFPLGVPGGVCGPGSGGGVPGLLPTTAPVGLGGKSVLVFPCNFLSWSCFLSIQSCMFLICPASGSFSRIKSPFLRISA